MDCDSPRKGSHSAKTKTAISDLVTLGLLKQEELSSSVRSPRRPVAEGESDSISGYRYLQQMVALAAEALELPRAEREMNGLTVAIPRAQLPIVKKKFANSDGN